jgi:hypothetical protein
MSLALTGDGQEPYGDVTASVTPAEYEGEPAAVAAVEGEEVALQPVARRIPL